MLSLDQSRGTEEGETQWLGQVNLPTFVWCEVKEGKGWEEKGKSFVCLFATDFSNM